MVITSHVIFSSFCFQHKQPSCKCTDTTMASSREDLPDWARVHHLNKEAAKDREDDVDVLFLGDSLTEGWLGMSYGRKNAVVHDVPNVFKSLFSTQDEGEGVYEGLALGISGDTVSLDEQVKISADDYQVFTLS